MRILHVPNLLSSLLRRRFLRTSAAFLSPVPDTNTRSSYTCKFLVDSVGLTLESAIPASRKFQLDEARDQKSQALVELLKSFDFSGTQIAKLIEKRPEILRYRLDGLRTKMDFLVQNGVVGQLLPELILSNPIILRRALDRFIKPSFEFLKLWLGSDEKVVSAIKRTSWLLTFDLKSTMQPNMDFLVKEGVPVRSITKMIMTSARFLTHGLDRMVYVVNDVKSMGLEPESSMFMRAVTVRICMTDSTWKRKFEVLNSLGMSTEEIVSAFKKLPYLLATSEDKLRSMLDFYLNTMNLEPQYVFARPYLFAFSIDRRILPRYNVLKVLKSKNLIKENRKVVWLFLRSEKDFTNQIVLKYVDKVPGLLDIYNARKKQSRSQIQNSTNNGGSISS
ncbi:hypothetical protein K2173_024818 [Erythroxylum novogranatense]|uniref:Uncharacterized protein n=1 Tax=Erythroxylum novogranatense TaxID=1862640 RepID=A0AAV8UF58_9ROSI|nr:hypothetical protein K2173_024818 [Erythroxylum novogranatense]